MQQVVDGVVAALVDADPGALGVGVLRVPTTILFSGSSLMACIASSTLTMLAGRCLPCGSLAAMTSPESRSATSQASADTSLGSGVPAATMTPHPLRASPPTGLAGTGSGWGGSPAVGTSDESTAGGVDTRYGQLLGSGAAWAGRGDRRCTDHAAGDAATAANRARVLEGPSNRRIGDRRGETGEPRCYWCGC